jgi:hypothetical protein
MSLLVDELTNTRYGYKKVYYNGSLLGEIATGGRDTAAT